MSSVFSSEQIEAGRRTFHLFMSFNVLAFSILTGNVMSVFAVKLDVSNTYIGLLQSFTHLSMVFMLVGRLLMQVMRSVSVFTLGWFARYVFASALLLIPLVIGRADGTRLATIIILVAMGGFQIFRGIGVAGQVPIVASLASGSDRGRFLSVNSILANSIALGGGVAIALLLGGDAPVSRFILAFAFAIACGFASVVQVRRLPEPRLATRDTFRSFLTDVAAVAGDRPVRRFLVFLCGFALGSSIMVAFLVVLAKRVFLLPDNYTVFLVAVGNLGAVAAGMVNRKLVDTSGARPMIVFYVGVMLFVSVAMIFVAGLASGAAVAMALAFFVAFAAQGGIFVSSQSYYFGLYPEEKHRNLGMLYSLVMGSVGAIGSYAGGRLLDVLEAQMNIALAFSWLFVVVSIVCLGMLVASLRLAPDRRARRRKVGALIALRVRRFADRIRVRRGGSDEAR